MQTDTSVIMLNTSLIIPNKYQPRKIFDEKALNNLAESIKNYGIINPILVRKKDDKYEIIAGERRFRAAQKIGLNEVPVIVKNADEQQMAELALIENLERQGLSPIEEAKSYEEIMRIGNQTQASLAEKLGKSQSSIANKIRLLSLPQEIQDALANKKISERHARSLIAVEDKERQIELLNKIITEKLTVKETDQIIKEKDINEEDIKQAISDIMKSLNIKEEEKEDDNMNNGNFFPSFDNNVANNNTSLNMMNMQSMNQPPVAPAPETVMPTIAPTPMQATPVEPQLVVPQAPAVDLQPQMPSPEIPVIAPTISEQTPNLNMNNSFDPMVGFNPAPDALVAPQTPTIEQPIINDAPLFGPTLMSDTPVEPQLVVPQAPAVDLQPQMPAPEIPVTVPPMMDEPLFNPNLTMPSVEPTLPTPMPEAAPTEPQMVVPEPPVLPSFEVPVNAPVTPELQVNKNKLTELQDLLNTNGYTYKVYSNETDNCVIIELPKN